MQRSTPGHKEVKKLNCLIASIERVNCLLVNKIAKVNSWIQMYCEICIVQLK